MTAAVVILLMVRYEKRLQPTLCDGAAPGSVAAAARRIDFEEQFETIMEAVGGAERNPFPDPMPLRAPEAGARRGDSTSGSGISVGSGTSTGGVSQWVAEAAAAGWIEVG